MTSPDLKREKTEKFVPIAFPGPWWTNLTYAVPGGAGRVLPGTRVRAPLGRGERVGLVTAGVPAGAYAGEIKEITEVIDSVPALSENTMALFVWFCDAHLCGFGTAMKTLLPGGFLKGKSIAPPAEARRAGAGEASFVYEPLDAARFERYAAMLADGSPTVVSFPLYPDAAKFFRYIEDSPLIPDEIKKRTILYPRTGGAAEWRLWENLRSPDNSTLLVIGGQNSAMAPLRNVSRFIVEDESNNAWRTVRPPVFSVRSLIASRARAEGAELALGGRMPSARAFMRGEAADMRSSRGMAEKTRNKIIFVDMKLAYTPSVEGFADGLAVSGPLVRETEAAVSRGEWALWILDRKGYAGEIVCDECGAPARCGMCGGAARAERDGIKCVSCGAGGPMPGECPKCAGRLLSMRRPGLEALFPLADAAISSPVPILGPDDGDEKISAAVRGNNSGVIFGTRAILSICDSTRVGLIGWIDADGEARSDEHSAKQRAFSLIWESLWRGADPLNRRVLVQTRRPKTDWQQGLDVPRDGWRIFWRGELRERRELSMPPFVPLVKAEGRASEIGRIAELAAGYGFECWLSGEDGKKTAAWIRTKRLAELRRTLEPYFHISNARKGYLSLTVWHE